MNELTDDELKIVIVNALRSLCLKYKNKYEAIMQFLAQMLIRKGGFEFRRTILDSFLTLIREIPQSKESGKLFPFETNPLSYHIHIFFQ
jgi:coatomer protein complex subunit gamma